MLTYLMIITIACTSNISKTYYGRGGWGWGGGYGFGLGYGLGWGYPGWGWGGYWGYPGWGWGGYWGGYPYYNNRRAADDANYYAQKAKDASLRTQQAEERVAQVNRRRKLRQKNLQRSRNQGTRNAPPGYSVRSLKY